MGIYNRDYYRNDPRSQSDALFGEDPGIKGLIAVNVMVFIWQNFVGRDGELIFLYYAPNVLHGEVWRLLTYGFCHGGAGHIFWNMFGLWIFGRMLEPVWQTREFVAFYLTAIVFCGLVQFGIDWARPESVGPALGASGGVMAVIIAAAMIYPHAEMSIWGLVNLELRWYAGLYVILDVLAIGSSDHVAHSMHLAGAVFGAAYCYFGWNLTGWLSGQSRRRPRPQQFRIFTPAAESPPPASPPAPPPAESPLSESDLSARVDEILKKISTQGESSLTEAERQTLKAASQKYKNR